jgi:hypothetical protein
MLVGETHPGKKHAKKSDGCRLYKQDSAKPHQNQVLVRRNNVVFPLGRLVCAGRSSQLLLVQPAQSEPERMA